MNNPNPVGNGSREMVIIHLRYQNVYHEPHLEAPDDCGLMPLEVWAQRLTLLPALGTKILGTPAYHPNNAKNQTANAARASKHPATTITPMHVLATRETQCG